MMKAPREFFEVLIQDLPPSEHWYFVMGLPPFATVPFSEIERTPFEGEETWIVGALGTVAGDLTIVETDEVVDEAMKCVSPS
jgi:hypothetical protein